MSRAPISLLVVDDETPVRRFLRASLNPKEYELLEACSGEEALRVIATRNPDVVILDLGLPDMDGADVARQVREWSQVPIIVLSARGREEDKVAALDSGADDYLTKPFGVAELTARIRVAMRHRSLIQAASPEPLFESGDLKVDLANRRVSAKGEQIHLTPNEYKLLATLVRHPGRVMTHKQLLEEVWGPAYADETHLLRVFMGQLRHKVEIDPAKPKHLLTESGVGYRLEVE